MPSAQKERRQPTRVSTRVKTQPKLWAPVIGQPKPRSLSIEIYEGQGTPLGNLEQVVEALTSYEGTPFIVDLHEILFNRRAKAYPHLENVLQFSGFPMEDEETEEEAIERIELDLHRYKTNLLKQCVAAFGLNAEKRKDDIVSILAHFLFKPSNDAIVTEPSHAARRTGLKRNTKDRTITNIKKSVRDQGASPVQPRRKRRNVNN
ncbi:hypothetical protein P9112_012094 [Eukaryota sp. TZLM1-RC]